MWSDEWTCKYDYLQLGKQDRLIRIGISAEAFLLVLGKVIYNLLFFVIGAVDSHLGTGFGKATPLTTLLIL